MDARETVETYYETLREAQPLGPYFASPAENTGPTAPIVKFGISETLVGFDAVRDGLTEQTRTTTDWHVDSRALRVTERDRYAWFSDDVDLRWTDTERNRVHEFETRWSGTLERQSEAGAGAPANRNGPDWRFVGMHVSTADVL